MSNAEWWQVLELRMEHYPVGLVSNTMFKDDFTPSEPGLACLPRWQPTGPLCIHCDI